MDLLEVNGMNWNKLNKIFYGGDYNPDQWDMDVWEDDIEKMKTLRVNTVTLPVFSWAKLQPEEDRFDFDWLEQRIKQLAEANIQVILATPTAAQPPWMVKKYPQMQPVNKFGVRSHYGGRTNFCPNNSDYRRLSAKIAKEMAIRFGNNKAIALWHINNEYGTHCYCETCRKAFILWLQEKYTTLEILNQKWTTAFWGHTYYDWDEIQVVSAQTELLPGRLAGRDGTNFQGMAVDYKRFMTDSIVACFKNESIAIKEHSDVPITSNIWGVSNALDLFRFSEAVDVVSWDNYPSRGEHYSVAAFKHDLIRSTGKDNAFLLMEQTPNQQNWQNYNAVKRPGVMRLMSHQTLAHGADGILFFQFRQSRGACEKYHAAMVPHAGHLNTRIGQELIRFGEELELLNEIIDSEYMAKVAIMMSWENWWNVEYSSGPSVDLDYLDQLIYYYKVLNGLNIAVDFVEPSDDLSKYRMVVAPVLNMVSLETKANIESFTQNGGTFITTFFSGVVDEYDVVHPGAYPGALRDLMGIWVEEVDALLPGEVNALQYEGETYQSTLICEIIHATQAKIIATYEKDFYAGCPCMTENTFGKGKAIYLGSHFEEALVGKILGHYLEACGVSSEFKPMENIEVVCRQKPGKKYVWLMNHGETQVQIQLPLEYKLLKDMSTHTLVLEPKAVEIAFKRTLF
jgi:beta-galactosidase